MSTEIHSKAWRDEATDIIHVKVTLRGVSEDPNVPYAYKKSIQFKMTEEMMLYSAEGQAAIMAMVSPADIEEITFEGNSPHLETVRIKKGVSTWVKD